MSYMLGLSNRPFKEPIPPPPPRPPQPNALIQMVTTPGGLLEWTASDGRKGKLMASGRQRLNAASLAKVPSVKNAASTKAASKKAATEGAPSTIGGMFGLFDGPAITDSGKTTRDSPSDWSKLQDEKLMELKAEQQSWIKIAEEVGKDIQQCKQRFKQIKPTDWKPNSVKKSNHRSGDSGKGKGGRGQANRQNGTQNTKRSANDSKNAWGADNNGSGKDDNVGWGGANTSWDNVGNADEVKDKTEDTAWDSCGWPTYSTQDNGGTAMDVGWGKPVEAAEGDNSGAWNTTAGAWDTTEGNATTGAWGTSGGHATAGAWDTTGSNEAAAAWDTVGGNATTAAWDTTGGANGSTNGVEDTTANAWGATSAGGIGQENTNSGAGFDAWNTDGNAWPTLPSIKAPSKPPTVKPASHHPHSPMTTTHPIIAAPLELEIRPDTTFSADDLRLLARILQQDCRLVWDRVSWRFRDKTGRTLHPDVFERKITGRVEGESRAKDERRNG